MRPDLPFQDAYPVSPSPLSPGLLSLCVLGTEGGAGSERCIEDPAGN
jgi:hypothetical protein